MSDGDYIYAKTKDAFTLVCVPKPGQTEAAISAAIREVMRATKFGFTPTEFVRAKSEYMSQLERIYTNRNKRENSVYCQLYTRNFLDNEPIPSIEDEYMTMQQLSQAIPVDIINENLKQLVSVTDTNLVVLNFKHREGRRSLPDRRRHQESHRQRSRRTAYGVG